MDQPVAYRLQNERRPRLGSPHDELCRECKVVVSLQSSSDLYPARCIDEHVDAVDVAIGKWLDVEAAHLVLHLRGLCQHIPEALRASNWRAVPHYLRVGEDRRRRLRSSVDLTEELLRKALSFSRGRVQQCVHRILRHLVGDWCARQKSSKKKLGNRRS